MRIIMHFLFLAAAWKWGDWRNWKKYYPTILFLIIGDLLYNFLTYHYTMWKFEPISFDRNLYSNHTLITLGIDFINFPAMVLIYLTHFPKSGLKKQLGYILIWAIGNSVLEFVIHLNSGLSYANGWNYWWSATFNVILYALLWIHFVKPILSWVLAWIVIVSYSLYFGLPQNVMK